MIEQEFAEKYNREVQALPIIGYEQAFSIACNETDEAACGRFVITSKTRFSEIVLFARLFRKHRLNDVIDDLLLLQLACRMRKKMH